MSLVDLQIHHVRNITHARIAPHPQFNIFLGANGSGKTSLLEAIYLLSTGHSFRTREISPLVSNNEPALTVFAATVNGETVSIQKSCSGPTHVKLNKQPCYSNSELARFLPCQVFYQDIFQIIDAGPGIRRSLLDWGLFHVKHSYHALWKDYRRVLKQRNVLLRKKAPRQDFIPWDNQLVSLSYQLDGLRSDYFKAWAQSFHFFLTQLTDISCTISYYKGWDRKEGGKDLATILAEQFDSDCQRQFTQSGAHQADIYFDTSLHKAKQTLSRGQQKIILFSLKLAQAAMLDRPCVYLFDDITAELDHGHLQRLIDCLLQLKGQFFLTAIDLPEIPALVNQNLTLFKLKNGRLRIVSRETEVSI